MDSPLLVQPSLFVVEPSVMSAVSIKTDQRFTPQVEIEKVRRSLGGSIGLDPCANPGKTVPAMFHITEKDNCFLTDWIPFLAKNPTVFMNPPYSGSAPFISELCRYVENGSIRSAITLTLSGVLSNKSTQGLIDRYAIAICHPFGRINFVNGGNSNDRDVVYILWGASASVELFKTNMTGLISRIEK